MKREELRKKISDTEELHELWAKWITLIENYRLTRNLCTSEPADREILELAQSEMADLEGQLSELEICLKAALLKPDKHDRSSAILEVRAGTGGDEAALFSAELFEMYQRFSELNGWNFDVITRSEDGPRALRVS